MTTPLVKMIAKAVKAGLVGAKATEAVTLNRITPGARTPGSLASGTNPTTTAVSCRGFESSEKHDKIGGTVVDQTHKVICIVGVDTAPTSNDTIAIRGVTFSVLDLEGSPALWKLLVRK